MGSNCAALDADQFQFRNQLAGALCCPYQK